MSRNILSQVAAGPAPGGHRITFHRLDGSQSMTLAELHAGARRLAAGLRAQGLGPGDRVGIMAANGPEWVLLDLAGLMLGAVTAGLERGKFEPGPDLLARYDLAVLFTDAPLTAGAAGSRIRPVRQALELAAGEEPGPALVPPEYQPGDVTTIKFTSGSTGEPKGLGASAGSIDSSIRGVQQMFGHGAPDHGRGDNLFLFLPLSLLQQRYWIYSALVFGHDVTVSTYETAFPALGRTAPTVVMGVPGFYETARRQIERRAGPGASPADLGVAARRLFGDRIRYLWTGSAPARPSLLTFFADAGLPLYEGYGLNETCIVAKNHPGAHRPGSVGQVLPGKKVLLDDDGRVRVWSEFPVSDGYAYAGPGESERVFLGGGVVRTGDLGYLDDDGFLFIRGRADDVIVLDNGRKVIVAPLEEFLRASPAIEECVVLCPAQTGLVAVVSPAGPADEAAIAARLKEANASFGADEQIGGLVIAGGGFTIGNGLLTSQYKPRREQIRAAYSGEIAGVARGR